MSTNTSLATLEERFTQIDTIASGFLSLNATGAGSFSIAIQTAGAMRQLRELLTEETMKPVMELMNSPLGFLTDKDPKRPQWKNGREVVPDPYSLAVVRDCVIEATLRGIPIVGNCFNIIGTRTYVTKEGFGVLLKKISRFSDLKIIPGVPKIMGENGALVEMEATWKKDGNPDSLRQVIPVRVNSGMGTDAILGKAARKLKCAIYNQVTGSELSDGDVEETALAEAKAAKVTGVTTTPTTVAMPKPAAAAATSAPGSTVAANPPASSSAPVSNKPASDPGPFGSSERPLSIATPAEGVANLIKATPGVTEDGVVDYCKRQEQCDVGALVLEDVPPAVLGTMIEMWAKIVDELLTASKSSAVQRWSAEPETKATPAVVADEDMVAKVRALIAAEGISEEVLIDWCIGKRFCGPSANAVTALPDTRLTWLLNNGIAKNKSAILAGPKPK